VWPARGQVLTTEPLDEQLFACPHYARHGFDYWQQLTDGRIVLGGFRDFSILTEMTDEETTTEPIQQALDSFLVDLLGWMPEVTHRWAGIFGLTQDLLPLVGPLPTRRDVGRRRLLRPRQRPRVLCAGHQQFLFISHQRLAPLRLDLLDRLKRPRREDG
jgi:glycine/D-amino acid oxidase-like deaminating enzyme